MREALAQVKQRLGEDAVILGTRSCPTGPLGNLVGRREVEITAAAPDTPGVRGPRVRPSGPARRRPDRPAADSGGRPSRRPGAAAAPRAERDAARRSPAGIEPFYERLVRHEVADDIARRLASQAAALGGNLRDPDDPTLGRLLRAVIGRMVPQAGGIALAPGRPRRVALVGPAGAGKTTTLAKLAAQFKLRMRKRVVILSLDMQRIGANDQMRRYAEIIGVPMLTAQTVGGVKDALRTMPAADIVLIDTHGVCTTQRGHFARLAALVRAARPDETHLVLPVSMAPRVQERMAQRFGPLGVSKVVLTHLDEAVGLGVILSAIDRLRWGLSYVTDGESVPNHISENCSESVAQAVLAGAG